MPQMAVTNLPMHSTPGMSMPMLDTAGGRSIVQSALGWALGWLAMATAMMLPAALPAVRTLALTVLPRRRQRTIALFLSSYLVVWLFFGVVAVAFVALLRASLAVGATTIAATALFVAAMWELTAWRRRSLRACQTVAPSSLRALALALQPSPTTLSPRPPPRSAEPTCLGPTTRPRLSRAVDVSKCSFGRDYRRLRPLRRLRAHRYGISAREALGRGGGVRRFVFLPV